MTDPSVAHLRHLDDSSVISRAREVFLHQVRASASVRPVFFPDTPPPPVPPVDPGWVDDLAVALVCSSIATSSLHGLGERVDERRCAQICTQALDPALSTDARRCGQKLYEWAFPGYCVGDGLCFGNYLGIDAAAWGEALADEVVGQQFIDDLGTRMEAADPHWSHDLDLILYKLSRLAPDHRHPTLQAWQQAFPGAPIDYTPPGFGCLAPSMFSPGAYLPEVIEALGGHGLPDVTDGVRAVASFLETRAEALATEGDTGPVPDDEGSKIVGCFVPGTPVLICDEDELIEVPIDEVGAGDAVVSGHGVLSRCTAEAVRIPLLCDAPVYGINDDPPFFSAGHLFLTPDGWRALDPATARSENPDRDVAPLQEGDLVYVVGSRVRAGEEHGACYEHRAGEERCGGGITHRTVRVDRITRAVLPAGSWLYGLHLDGDPSYHAHGYCVGANYPVFTERRMAEGFSLLSAAERDLVRDALAPVMPLLTRALGAFVGHPLLRALAGDSPRRPPTPRLGFTGPQTHLARGSVPRAQALSGAGR